ncbi:hypothetical protein AUJ46_04475 [Candidatus Peregrinibacteria bacterium CG1_02_54_53]|nr:MAG: hypothetical protein AUJ46_04475 [Candidatus Peregrinibacteria bacterium CG1_02_54_53]
MDRTAILSLPFARNADLLDQRNTGTASGSIPVLTNGGALSLDGNLTINADNEAANAVLTFGNNVLAETLQFNHTTSGFEFSNGLRISGDLETTGTMSGAVHAQNLLTSSGALSVEGSAYAHTYYGTGGTLRVETMGNATYSTIQDLQNIFHSTGYVDGGEITDGGSETINVAAGQGLIRSADSGTGTLYFFDWPASSGLSIATDTIRYVGVQYNGGNPQVVVKTTDSWDNNTEFPLGSVVNETGTLQILHNPQQVGDHAARMIERSYQTSPFARDSRDGGLMLGETGTRNVTVSAGALWDRLNRFDLSAIDTSGSDTFDTYLGTTLDTAGATQWDNQNYDNGGVKTTLTTGRYANLWFYMESDGDLVMVYGTNQYGNLASAEAESAPATIPNRIISHGKLIGRIVFKKGENTASSIHSAFTTTLSLASAADHGNLAGLTDDDHTQYLLLTGRGGQSITDSVEVTGTASGRILSFGQRLTGSGSVSIRTVTDSTTAVQVLDADGGTPVFNIDTANERVGIGTATPETELEVVGTMSGSSIVNSSGGSYVGTAACYLTNGTLGHCTAADATSCSCAAN